MSAKTAIAAVSVIALNVLVAAAADTEETLVMPIPAGASRLTFSGDRLHAAYVGGDKGKLYIVLDSYIKNGRKTVAAGEVVPRFGPIDANYIKNGWSPRESQTGDPIERIAGFMRKLADIDPSPEKVN